MRIFKSLIIVSLLSLLWMLLWACFALFSASLYSSLFSYSSISASFYQCLHINLFRTGLYLVLFYGQLVIINAFSVAQPRIVDYFKIPFSFDSIKTSFIQLVGLKNQQASDNLNLLIKNLIWISYWYFISFTIFWSTLGHFMGDCDDGDLECTCNNLPYLLPAFLITLIVGSLVITSTNYKKNTSYLQKNF
jgi:hypothetical protein